MQEISCDVCMDLLPLVRDGVASEDSKRLVEQHLRTCSCCTGVQIMPEPDENRLFLKLQKRMRLFWAMVLMLGLVCGMTLSGGGDLFYNIILMPMLGALAYGLFRWMALLWMPLLVFGTHILTNCLGLGDEVMDVYSVLMWSAIYCVIALVGFAIAALLHFAFRKEK